MKIIKILILVLLPQMAFGSNNWQVVDTQDVPGESHVCLVTPISMNGTLDIWVMYRKNDTNPMVKFAVRDKYANSFKYVIDHPNIPEKVQEILPDRNGSLFINGEQASRFINELKKGNQIRYLISSSKHDYETRTHSLIGFTKAYNQIKDCQR